jgi:hypothetical protein
MVKQTVNRKRKSQAQHWYLGVRPAAANTVVNATSVPRKPIALEESDEGVLAHDRTQVIGSVEPAEISARQPPGPVRRMYV